MDVIAWTVEMTGERFVYTTVWYGDPVNRGLLDSSTCQPHRKRAINIDSACAPGHVLAPQNPGTSSRRRRPHPDRCSMDKQNSPEPDSQAVGVSVT